MIQGKLQIVSVGDNSHVIPTGTGGITYQYTDEYSVQVDTYYQTFVDSIGQPHLDVKDIPFKSLVEKQTVSAARIQFRSA